MTYFKMKSVKYEYPLTFFQSSINADVRTAESFKTQNMQTIISAWSTTLKSFAWRKLLRNNPRQFLAKTKNAIKLIHKNLKKQTYNERNWSQSVSRSSTKASSVVAPWLGANDDYAPDTTSWRRWTAEPDPPFSPILRRRRCGWAVETWAEIKNSLN